MKEDSTLEVKEMLLYAIQDEYLANKEYGMIMDEYGQQRPFSNIKSRRKTYFNVKNSAFNTK